LGFISAISIPIVNNQILVYILLGITAIAAASQVSLRIVTSSMVNNRIKADERATVLSVKSMFSRVFSGLAMIALKPLFDGVGVQTTFLIATIVVLLTVYPLLKLLRLKLIS
jgi:predicted transglutaminase-like protease